MFAGNISVVGSSSIFNVIRIRIRIRVLSVVTSNISTTLPISLIKVTSGILFISVIIMANITIGIASTRYTDVFIESIMILLVIS